MAEQTQQQPEWEPGLDPVTGMARHPSMREKSIPFLRRRIAAKKRELREAPMMLDTTDPEYPGWVQNTEQMIAAYELAIKERT